MVRHVLHSVRNRLKPFVTALLVFSIRGVVRAHRVSIRILHIKELQRILEILFRQNLVQRSRRIRLKHRIDLGAFAIQEHGIRGISKTRKVREAAVRATRLSFTVDPSHDTIASTLDDCGRIFGATRHPFLELTGKVTNTHRIDAAQVMLRRVECGNGIVGRHITIRKQELRSLGEILLDNTISKCTSR